MKKQKSNAKQDCEYSLYTFYHLEKYDSEKNQLKSSVGHCCEKGPYIGTWVPLGTFLTFWVPIGSLFIFQGPYFQCFGLIHAKNVNTLCMYNAVRKHVLLTIDL